MSETVEERLARYVSSVRFEDLSPAAVACAKRSTLDTIGAILAGSNAAGVSTVLALATGWGGRPEATVLGFGSRLPGPLGAWCNGTMARALEIDDCVDFLPVHPSASAVPALLTLAELLGGLSGREFITALALGQDVKVRMGLVVRKNAMQTGRNNMFKIFAPTAAIARAMRFTARQAHNALGLSFSFAVGDGQCALDGALSLRLQQGIVAQGALLSGLLTAREFSGAKDFLTGRFGYLVAFEPDPRLEYLGDDLGGYFYGEQITVKPFSACRATHASIELALDIGAGLDPASIKSITIQVCPAIYQLVAQSWEESFPDTAPAAQFSIQFTVAAAILYGDVFLRQLLPEALNDPRVLDLGRRVIVVPDPALVTDTVLGRTRIEIALTDGQVLAGHIGVPLGNPGHPMDDAACVAKFRKCVDYAAVPLNDRKIAQAIDMIGNLENMANVAEIVPLLCRAAG